MNIKTFFKERPVEVEIDHTGAACDAYVGSGCYLDGAMEDLDSDACDALTELLCDEIATYCMERDGYYRE